MANQAKPLGVLGGTFDPIHYGHLRLAEEALDACALERVILIPAAVPNLRAAPRTPAQHRLAMTRLAVQGNPRLAVDGRELNREGTSYTVDTLQELRAEFGAQRPLCLVLGADAFLRLPAWNRWQQLFALAHIIVATRPGYELQAAVNQAAELSAQCRTRMSAAASDLAQTSCGRIVSVTIPLLEISATDIRTRIAAAASTRYLLPDAVLDYIVAQHLYEN